MGINQNRQCSINVRREDPFIYYICMYILWPAIPGFMRLYTFLSAEKKQLLTYELKLNFIEDVQLLIVKCLPLL
jgi:hypothetical protein